MAMSLDRAMRFHDKSRWPKWTPKSEIENVVAECAWLEGKFQKVRELILAEKLGEAGVELEKLLLVLPDNFRRKLGVRYIFKEKMETELEEKNLDLEKTYTV